jgi:hypothetical protein
MTLATVSTKSGNKFIEYFHKADTYARHARQAMSEHNTPGFILFLFEQKYAFRKSALDALMNGDITKSDCVLMIAATDRWTAPIPKMSMIERMKVTWRDLRDVVKEAVRRE